MAYARLQSSAHGGAGSVIIEPGGGGVVGGILGGGHPSSGGLGGGSSAGSSYIAWHADIAQASDYYPGGMMMPGRYKEYDWSRHGFNGQMKTDEVYGKGNLNTAKFWEMDTRIMRRWNVDPVELIGLSSYAVNANNPIIFSDPNGDFVPAVPAILMFLGLVTSPTPAKAPTFNTYSDSRAMQSAYAFQTKWVVASLFMGRLPLGGQSVNTFGKHIVGQTLINTTLHTINESDLSTKEGRAFEMTKIVQNTINSIDLFDAAIGAKLNASTLTKVALGASVDITAEDAKVIGFTKPLSEFTVDVALGYLGDQAAKATGAAFSVTGSYGKTISKIFDKASEAANNAVGNEIKNKIGERDYNRMQRKMSNAIFKPDKQADVDNTGTNNGGGF